MTVGLAVNTTAVLAAITIMAGVADGPHCDHLPPDARVRALLSGRGRGAEP
jgi:hypothetical protein